MPLPLKAKCEEALSQMLELLSSAYGIDCDLSCGELLDYLSGSIYEEDTVGVEEVFSNEILLLHEVAEACILKSMRYGVGWETVMEAYPHTYSVHLKAMDVELSEALKRGNLEHVRRRCVDLHSYLSDSYLLGDLVSMVSEPIVKYCGTDKTARTPDSA